MVDRRLGSCYNVDWLVKLQEYFQLVTQWIHRGTAPDLGTKRQAQWVLKSMTVGEKKPFLHSSSMFFRFSGSHCPSSPATYLDISCIPCTKENWANLLRCSGHRNGSMVPGATRVWC